MPLHRLSKTTPRFNEPHESIELVKYINITKFLSLLKDSQLFFCRLDKLEDKFEGSLPKLTRKNYIDWYNYQNKEDFFKPPLDEETIEKETDKNFLHMEKLKSIYCVNCWNEFEGESYALWKIYSELNQGVMIKTTYQKLIDSLNETYEKIYCSKIKYINYEPNSIELGDTFAPFYHKHNAYSYEKEVRLIHEVQNTYWVHDWGSEKNENGVKINLNLSEMINEIVISPFSPDWFKELIEDILDKYSIQCNVVNSSLR